MHLIIEGRDEVVSYYYLYSNESILLLEHKQHIPFLTLSHLDSSFRKPSPQTSTSDKTEKEMNLMTTRWSITGFLFQSSNGKKRTDKGMELNLLNQLIDLGLQKLLDELTSAARLAFPCMLEASFAYHSSADEAQPCQPSVHWWYPTPATNQTGMHFIARYVNSWEFFPKNMLIVKIWVFEVVVRTCILVGKKLKFWEWKSQKPKNEELENNWRWIFKILSKSIAKR